LESGEGIGETNRDVVTLQDIDCERSSVRGFVLSIVAELGWPCIPVGQWFEEPGSCRLSSIKERQTWERTKMVSPGLRVVCRLHPEEIFLGERGFKRQLRRQHHTDRQACNCS
jgi:hypothetical protein